MNRNYNERSRSWNLYKTTRKARKSLRLQFVLYLTWKWEAIRFNPSCKMIILSFSVLANKRRNIFYQIPRIFLVYTKEISCSTAYLSSLQNYNDLCIRKNFFLKSWLCFAHRIFSTFLGFHHIGLYSFLHGLFDVFLSNKRINMSMDEK